MPLCKVGSVPIGHARQHPLLAITIHRHEVLLCRRAAEASVVVGLCICVERLGCCLSVSIESAGCYLSVSIESAGCCLRVSVDGLVRCLCVRIDGVGCSLSVGIESAGCCLSVSIDGLRRGLGVSIEGLGSSLSVRIVQSLGCTIISWPAAIAASMVHIRSSAIVRNALDLSTMPPVGFEAGLFLI